MRLPLLAAVLAVALAGPAAAAPRVTVPGTVLIVADVGESAQRSMPAALWRKLVTDYVGARTTTAEDGTALPDEAHCRSSHALYAVFATFERAMRLPGLAQDPDRVYGVARFTVRNCVTGTVSPAKTVRIESDPLSEADRGENEPNAERTWERAIRSTFARDPLVFSPAAPAAPAATIATVAPVVRNGPVARIARIDNTGFVFIERGGSFSMNQLLRDFADSEAKPHPPIELVVVEVGPKYVMASIIGKGTPHIGDLVEAEPAVSPSPAPPR
ncbi:MAG TPA: hypothetical protein VGX96_05505 [Candidatus Elarobacter sp.]|nr:hypothetical protein [Candidatus Elarobacter sp.]